MLYKAKDMLGCAIDAVDGEVGRVKDLYFDDATWMLRYLVVETGTWLNSREVLLVPSALRGADPAAGVFSTGLTCQQVKASPPVTADMPVSRQYEERLHDYYGWMPYWDVTLDHPPGLYVEPFMGGLGPPAAPLDTASRAGDETARQEGRELRQREAGDPHLRSFREVRGYHIAATDGHIGHVADCLVDPIAWCIPQLVIDTRNWLPAKAVVVDTGAVRGVDWAMSVVTLALSRQQVSESPPYDPIRLVDDDGYPRNLPAADARRLGVEERRPPPASPGGLPRGAMWPSDLPPGLHFS